MLVPATSCAWGDYVGGSHGKLRAAGSPVGPQTAEVHVPSRNCARRTEVKPGIQSRPHRELAGSSGLETGTRELQIPEHRLGSILGMFSI